mmetsp:Transcript_14914/g.43824  ORF Transcript_14914/g.43824 Transcript_14914/m.43824 type:complete len:123 (+) Transcript_14914:1735-2103(+)|eukprot:363369-Chlamydomonas_euryale.AAC.16
MVLQPRAVLPVQPTSPRRCTFYTSCVATAKCRRVFRRQRRELAWALQYVITRAGYPDITMPSMSVHQPMPEHTDCCNTTYACVALPIFAQVYNWQRTPAAMHKGAGTADCMDLICAAERLLT